MKWLPGRYTQRTRSRTVTSLTVRLTTAYFTRWADKRQKLESGPRPALLDGLVPSRRQWESYLSLLEQTNPIHLADRFLAELRRGSVRTYAQVADHFNVSTAHVCYYVALVRRLPADFVQWLRTCEDPLVVRHLTERRLRPVTRVKNEAEQRARLAAMVDEAQAQAGAWGGVGADIDRPGPTGKPAADLAAAEV